MKATNTIHINGKLYDARTGKLLSEAKKVVEKAAAVANTPVKLPKVTKSKTKRGNGFVDGISHNPNAKHRAKPHNSKKAAPAKTISKAQPKKATRPSHTVNSIKRHAAHSATLHRSAVKAPKITSSGSVTKSVGKKSAQAPSQRVERAQTIQRSTLISKFGSLQPAPKKPETMAEEPEMNLSLSRIAAAAEKARKAHTTNAVKNSLIAKSLEEANKQHQAPKKPHKAKKKRSKATRKLQLSTIGVAALVLAAYVTYLNVPSLSMKVASSRAGFAATLPGQTPSGYRLQGPIAYSPGQVVIKFGSNTDDRHFSIQQQPTTWDSEALKENYVAKNSSTEPTTYQDSGLTIFFYGGGDAAWVNDGKFYSLKSQNSQLDTAQIRSIATSM